MLRFLSAGLLALAASLAPVAQAQAPASPPAQAALPGVQKPLRVLFIGNSLTFWTDIPKRVAAVAAATGRKTQIESVAFPSYSLEDHWRDGRALEAIRKGWDVVVLQQGTSAHDEGRQELIDWSRRFAKPIRDAGAKPAMYQVWPLADRPKEFPAVIESYRQAAKAIDAVLIPAGEAWLRALNKEPRLKLYADGIHPSSFGSDIASLTIYLSLFPAGPQEFDEAFVAKVGKALEIPTDRRDLFFDAATLAIDSPLLIK
jgi:hypothetical protein